MGPTVGLVVDRFRLPELQDVVKNAARIEPRVTRWSDAAEDIRALRKMAKDGPLSVVPGARALVQASLSVSKVKSDDQGNTRLEKRTKNNEARDDIASALCLGVGALSRKPGKGSLYLGMA